MTEETKELINCIRVNLRHNKCFGGIDEIGCKLLLDCITNLQQNYNKLQDDYQEQYTYEYNLRKQLQHDLEKANDIIEKDRQFYKCRMDEYVELKKENEFLKLNNPEMNIEHFRIVKENKRKIDNLRKENERLTESLEKQRHFYLCKISKIQQENERLKQLNENASKVCVAEHKYGVEKAEEARDYKSRCEKAKEYINKHTYNPSQTINDERLEINPKYLLNILNRSDENEY